MDVDLLAVGAEDKPVIANLLQLYLHDSSEFEPGALSAHGVFDYAWLDSYCRVGQRLPGSSRFARAGVRDVARDVVRDAVRDVSVGGRDPLAGGVCWRLEFAGGWSLWVGCGWAVV
ncbi:hypothetical protein KGQ19_07805 [Catenulispora sp. NL8]|uniref:Uncharacterized protein n=1 Tax=Catenulispora pinistramenti TaxID=2705254 RepID=A0ABS5KL61_9ACTN|nr:hypothetical protein [Catenulispora pinistramenti]MBS2546770.1 hypothetical protein [Catenulispora pinistramenti]